MLLQECTREHDCTHWAGCVRWVWLGKERVWLMLGGIIDSESEKIEVTRLT